METIILLLMIYLLINSKKVNYYVIDPIPFFAIRIIASIWLSSHSLWCELRSWGICEETHWLWIFCLQQVLEFTLSHFDTMCCIQSYWSLLSIHCQFDSLATHSYHNHNVHSQLQQLSVEHWESLLNSTCTL